ncbi:hypothetical protein [Photobacterium kishitanii]|uniref:Uncharacterized protein n=1 Tax=Photobacterium kishitanii TaxID=318456 RepID=A0A2T3KLL9_9GAMM|nr:hypothetical protein [Photobacterium kishitanii]PSV00540.1 hypothetical protein C9J27_05240 [Photobacterium kishitanii]
MTYVFIEINNYCSSAPLCYNHLKTPKNTILESNQDGLGIAIDYIMGKLCPLGDVGVKQFNSISLNVVKTPDSLVALLFSVKDPAFKKSAVRLKIETDFALYTNEKLATEILDELKRDQELFKESLGLPIT